MGVKLPDRIGNRAVVAVDQQRPAGLILFAGMAGKVDFLHAVKRIARDVAGRIPKLVGAGDHDVVDIQQKAAAGAAGDFGDEIHFVPGAFGKAQVGRGVFQQHLPAKGVLDLMNVGRDARQGFVGIGHRQQIVQKPRLVA